MDVYSAWTSCHKMCLVCGLVLELCLVGSAFDQESPLTPGEAVQLWLKVYPEHLERAVDLTTLSFRQGVSKKEWVATQGPLLRGLRMRYSQGTVTYEETHGDEARVIVRARISTWMGDHVQDELYSLQKGPDGSWLVDRVDEYVEFNPLR